MAAAAPPIRGDFIADRNHEQGRRLEPPSILDYSATLGVSDPCSGCAYCAGRKEKPAGWPGDQVCPPNFRPLDGRDNGGTLPEEGSPSEERHAAQEQDDPNKLAPDVEVLQVKDLNH
jgi:hypothetical protein